MVPVGIVEDFSFFSATSGLPFPSAVFAVMVDSLGAMDISAEQGRPARRPVGGRCRGD